MDNFTTQSLANGEDEIAQRKKFAQQAGLSFQQLRLMQIQASKRETRNRRQPRQANLKSVPQLNPVQKSHKTTPGNDYTAQPNSDKIVKSLKPTVTSKTLKKQVKKLQNSLPKSVDQFYQNYNNFFNSIFISNQKDAKFIQLRKSELFNLLNTVISHNGIANIISNGEKNEILQPFSEMFCLKDAEQVFKIYKKFLLHFEYYLLENITFKEYHDPTDFFQEATFVSENQLRQFLDKSPLDPKYFQQDILVFQNGQKVIKINSQEISLDKVREQYKDYKIDIRIQKALDYGFKPKTMRNEPYQMKIGQYTTYQKLCQQYSLNGLKIDSNFIDRLGKVKQLDVNGTPFKDRVKSQEIFFGVNFDPEDGLLFDYLGEKTNGTFIGFKQQFDLLSYLDHQVPGCSFPQFYFKVKGVWTGGHQENVNMCAVNINHGPDASEWYTMDFKYVEEFRAQLKKQFKMDLYAGQGLWYQKINWFVEQGKYPIKKIIQKKGDIVISGPGTLHWVRSHGVALQSAWNQFPITYQNMKYAFHRQQQNEKIHFIRSNVIPLKRLTLKLLNHPRPELTPQIKSLCVEKIRQWLSNQEQIFEELISQQNSSFGEQKKFQKLDDLQGFCLKCKQEIFIYFVNGRSPQDVTCLNCYKKQSKGKKKSKKVFFRHDITKILALINLTQSGKPFAEIEAFCSNYVGNVPFKCSKNQQKVDKEVIFLQKINDMNKDLNKLDTEKLKQMTEKMKNKRKGSQKQEEENQIKNELKTPESMQLEDNNLNIQKPKLPMQFRMKNNVKYLGKRPNKSGWWDFQIPQHLHIMTEKSHQELLKLVEEQQHFVRRNAKREYRQYPSFAYQIKGPPYYSERPNPHMIETKEAQFSSQSEEDQNINGRKKIHKNQDIQVKSQKREKIFIVTGPKTVDKVDIQKKNFNEITQKKEAKIELQTSERKSFSKSKRSNSRSTSPQRNRENRDERKYEQNTFQKKQRRYQQSSHSRIQRTDREESHRRNDYSSREKRRDSQSRKQKSYEQKDQRKYDNGRSQSRYRENDNNYQSKQRSSFNNQRRDNYRGRQFNQRNDNRREQRDQGNQKYSRQNKYQHDNRDNRYIKGDRFNYDSRNHTNKRYDNNYRNQRESYSQKPNNYRRDDRSYQEKQRTNNYEDDKAKRVIDEKKEDKDIEIQY